MTAQIGEIPWGALYMGDVAAVAAYMGDVQVWGPQIGDPIGFLAGSVGFGRNDGTGSDRSAAGTMLIDENAFDRMAVGYVVVSHENWINNVGLYGTFTLSSHLDGPFQRLETVFFGQGDTWQTSFQGSITPFVLPYPTVGLHTITAFLQTPAQWVNSLKFQVQAYKNVLAVSNPAVGRVLRDPARLALSRPTARENITLCGVAHDRLPLITDGVNQPVRGATRGGPVLGAGDFLTVLEAPPGNASGAVDFDSVSAGVWAAAAVDLIGYHDGEFNAITTDFREPGTYTYPIPAAATMLDIVTLGSGAGSWGTGFGGSNGAGAGQWSSATIPIGGAQIPPGTTSLTVVVGAGAAAVTSNTAGNLGNPSKVSRAGTDLVVGPGATSTNTGTPVGAGPGNHTRSGIEYIGGAPTDGYDQNGNSPGGGGGGRYNWFAPGWPGGHGAVWIRAY